MSGLPRPQRFTERVQEAARKRARRLSEHLCGEEGEPQDLLAAEALMSLGEAEEVGLDWPPSRFHPAAHLRPQVRTVISPYNPSETALPWARSLLRYILAQRQFLPLLLAQGLKELWRRGSVRRAVAAPRRPASSASSVPSLECRCGQQLIFLSQQPSMFGHIKGAEAHFPAVLQPVHSLQNRSEGDCRSQRWRRRGGA